MNAPSLSRAIKPTIREAGIQISVRILRHARILRFQTSFQMQMAFRSAFGTPATSAGCDRRYVSWRIRFLVERCSKGSAFGLGTPGLRAAFILHYFSS